MVSLVSRRLRAATRPLRPKPSGPLVMSRLVVTANRPTPLDQIIVDPALHRGEIAAGGEVEGQSEPGVDPVGAQDHIVRDQPRPGDAELAVEPDVGDGAAGDRVEAQDPRRPRRHRHDDVAGADPGVADRAQPLDRGAAESEARRAQLVEHVRRGEGAVEDHGQADVAPGEIGRDRAGLEQPAGDPADPDSCWRRGRAGPRRRARGRGCACRKRMSARRWSRLATRLTRAAARRGAAPDPGGPGRGGACRRR